MRRESRLRHSLAEEAAEGAVEAAEAPGWMVVAEEAAMIGAKEGRATIEAGLAPPDRVVLATGCVHPATTTTLPTVKNAIAVKPKNQAAAAAERVEDLIIMEADTVMMGPEGAGPTIETMISEEEEIEEGIEIGNEIGIETVVAIETEIEIVIGIAVDIVVVVVVVAAAVPQGTT